jgi:hypothetical protein
MWLTWVEMALATLAETKVARPPGRDPALSPHGKTASTKILYIFQEVG